MGQHAKPANSILVYNNVKTSNAKLKSTSKVLRFPSLIFDILKLKKNILKEGEILEVPRKPILILNKVYISTHVKDVEDDEDE